MVRWPHNTRTSGRIFCGHLAARFMVTWPLDAIRGFRGERRLARARGNGAQPAPRRRGAGGLPFAIPGSNSHCRNRSPSTRIRLEARRSGRRGEDLPRPGVAPEDPEVTRIRSALLADVSAEAACEILHKAFPRRRRNRGCRCHNDSGRRPVCGRGASAMLRAGLNLGGRPGSGRRPVVDELVVDKPLDRTARGTGIAKGTTAGELIDGCSPGRRDLALHQVGEAGDPFRGLGLHGGTDLRP